MGTEIVQKFVPHPTDTETYEPDPHADESGGYSLYGKGSEKENLDRPHSFLAVQRNDGNPLSDDFKSYKSSANKLCENSGIENFNELEEGLFDKVQSSFRNFFDGLSIFGTGRHGNFSTSVAADMSNIVGGIAPGANTGIAIVRTICAQLAFIFQSTSEEVARTVFSGVCIVSTAIRTALPIAMEMAKTAKNKEEIFVFSVAAAVMASVYLVTSSISVLLAGHHAILNSPSTAAMARDVREEANRLSKEKGEDFSKAAQASLKKIGRMLREWKANTSANLLSLGKEFLLFGGAAISAVSALSKFAPVLTVPFVSIITGSISLVANLAEMVQGIVEYRSQKARLEELINGADHKPETQMEIKRLENQLKVSKLRIAKGALNVLISVANIVFGALTVLTSFSMPIVPAILAAVSLTTVLVLSVAGLVVRKVNTGTAVEKTQPGANPHSANQDTDTNETESDKKRKELERLNSAYV